ncbi:MAG: hypothetical protein RSA01_04290 [Clostridium sp.]
MVKIIKFFLFDDLNYRINYTSDGVDKKISSIIVSLFLSYFVKGIKSGILYKKIEDKHLILRVDYEEEEKQYVVQFVYVDSLDDYPIKIMYESGFIDSDFKHQDYQDLEFETLSRYMKSIDGQGFRQMVSGLFRSKYYNSSIRIRGHAKELLLWIGIVQTVFPIELAQSVSFKVENYSNGMGMASISISDNIVDVRYRFSLEGDNSNVEQYKFTSMLERHYLVPSTNLEAFFLFATHFDYKVLDERIEDIYNIYMISRLGLGDYEYSDVKVAFDTLEEIGSKEAKRIVILNMLKVIDKLTTEIDIKFFKLIIGFSFRAAKEMESLFINEMCKELYIKSLVSLLFNGRYRDVYQLEEAVLEVEKFTDTRELYKYILDDKRIEHINIYMNIDFTPDRVMYMVKYILSANIALGYKWNKLSEKLMGLVNISIKSMVREELEYEEFFFSMSGDDEYIASMMLLIFEKIENEKLQEHFMKCITSFFKKSEESLSTAIRKRLSYSENGLIFLYEEFKSYMIGSKYTLDGFIEYMPSFLCAKEYFDKYFSRAAAHVLSNIEENEGFKFSIYMINQITDKHIPISIFSDKVLHQIVLFIEDRVDFANCEEVYAILDGVSHIKRDRKVVTPINITRMLQLQRSLQRGEEIDIYEFEHGAVSPKRLSEASYKKYRDINLEAIASLCSDKEDHKIVTDVFMTEDRFIFDYMMLCLNDKNIHSKVAVSFIIYYLYYVHPVYKMSGKEKIAIKLREMLIDRICELKFSLICEIDERVKEEFEKEHLSMPVEWEEIFSSIKKIKSESSLVDKFKFMMKK